MTAQHSSESNEHYTPKYIVEPVRETLGGIDLDPATTERANRIVKAKRIFTAADDGLSKRWSGTVFLNPPGGLCDVDGIRVIRRDRRTGRKPCVETGDCGLPPGHKHKGVTSSAVVWWKKLMHEFHEGDVSAAIFVGFSIELLQTAQSLPWRSRPTSHTLCVPKERIPFNRVENGKLVKGAQPTHANVIVCVTADAKVEDRFDAAFSKVGAVFNL